MHFTLKRGNMKLSSSLNKLLVCNRRNDWTWNVFLFIPPKPDFVPNPEARGQKRGQNDSSSFLLPLPSSKKKSPFLFLHLPLSLIPFSTTFSLMENKKKARRIFFCGLWQERRKRKKKRSAGLVGGGWNLPLFCRISSFPFTSFLPAAAAKRYEEEGVLRKGGKRRRGGGFPSLPRQHHIFFLSPGVEIFRFLQCDASARSVFIHFPYH